MMGVGLEPTLLAEPGNIDLPDPGALTALIEISIIIVTAL